MPAHHSQGRKLLRTAARRKTRLCRFFLSESGCTNGSSCAFAHGAEELQALLWGKDAASTCSISDDSTSMCSEETSLESLGSSDTTCEVMGPSLRQCWADVEDGGEQEDDEWQSMWAPQPQPEMRELPMASARHPCLPPGMHSVAIGQTTASKTERRECAAAMASAKRATLTGAVLEGLLQQAQGPHLYQD